MVKVSYLVERFAGVEREVRLLRRALESQVFVPSLYGLLKLNKSELHVLIALNILGMAEANDVARFLGIKRAMVSKYLNGLYRMGFVSKERRHKTCYFMPLFKITEKEGELKECHAYPKG